MSERQEYTPTTETVRHEFSHPPVFNSYTSLQRADQFDRWLAEVERLAAEKAWDQGANASRLTPNPHTLPPQIGDKNA